MQVGMIGLGRMGANMSAPVQMHTSHDQVAVVK